MATTNNLYAELLGLPEATVRPNYYELLGITYQQGDERIIKAAYYRQIAKVSVRQQNAGQQEGSTEAHEILLASLAEARDCLMDQSSRLAYDARLARRRGAAPKPKLTAEEKRQARAQRERVREAIKESRERSLDTQTPFSCSADMAPPTIDRNDGDQELRLQTTSPRIPMNREAISQVMQQAELDLKSNDSTVESGQEGPTKKKESTSHQANSNAPIASPPSPSHILYSNADSLFEDGEPESLFDTEPIAVATTGRRFMDRFSPRKTHAETVAAILQENDPTRFQNQVLKSGNPSSLLVGPYLIETQLKPTSAVALDTGYQVHGGSHQRFVSWGPVYLATHLHDQHRYAIRILPPNYRRELAPIRHWINKTQQIDSSSVCPCVLSGRDQQRIFVASKYFAGEDLYRMVNRLGPLSLDQALTILAKVTDTLIAAEARKMRHPELRPGKILVNASGSVVVRDFAIANLIFTRKMKQPNRMHLVPMLPADHVQFFAPENFRSAGRVDTRAEMYSLGCILRYLLTGTTTFALSQPAAIVAAHQTEPIGPVGDLRPEIAPIVDHLVGRLTAKDPCDRFSSLKQVKKAIDEVRSKAGIIAAGGNVWAAVQPVATTSTKLRTKVSPWHTGRAINSGLLSAAGISAVMTAGWMAPKLVGELTTPKNSVQPKQSIQQSQEKEEVRQPKIFKAEPSAAVPEVESVDTFLLD